MHEILSHVTVFHACLTPRLTVGVPVLNQPNSGQSVTLCQCLGVSKLSICLVSPSALPGLSCASAPSLFTFRVSLRTQDLWTVAHGLSIRFLHYVPYKFLKTDISAFGCLLIHRCSLTSSLSFSGFGFLRLLHGARPITPHVYMSRLYSDISLWDYEIQNLDFVLLKLQNSSKKILLLKCSQLGRIFPRRNT
jgi:hypothetical protein